MTEPKNTYVATSREEFRVETRSTFLGEIPSNWWPESDHMIFGAIEGAERWRDTRAAWYDAPDRFEHRIVRRTVTSWEPVQ